MKKQQYIIIGILIFLFIFSYYFYSSSNKQKLYKNDSDCAKNALSFVKEKNSSISTWEVIQSKFISDKNSCFAEFNSGGGITLIYDLTHNKELALYPAGAGQLYHDVPGGEKSETRIEYIKKYKEVKSEIFGN